MNATASCVRSRRSATSERTWGERGDSARGNVSAGGWDPGEAAFGEASTEASPAAGDRGDSRAPGPRRSVPRASFSSNSASRRSLSRERVSTRTRSSCPSKSNFCFSARNCSDAPSNSSLVFEHSTSRVSTRSRCTSQCRSASFMSSLASTSRRSFSLSRIVSFSTSWPRRVTSSRSSESSAARAAILACVAAVSVWEAVPVASGSGGAPPPFNCASSARM
mmetsp:Transcript_4449/g.13276  ORF Transcript_4449/g.13276 Transcript_4449/m.13276 type:complete len:221 (+) Transcript_4449:1074-1736(+)